MRRPSAALWFLLVVRVGVPLTLHDGIRLGPRAQRRVGAVHADVEQRDRVVERSQRLGQRRDGRAEVRELDLRRGRRLPQAPVHVL